MEYKYFILMIKEKHFHTLAKVKPMKEGCYYLL